MRAYTVTTGAWVRGFLADDYGVDHTAIHWVSFEDPHLAEYKDPDFVTRAPAGKTLVQMLLDGELDAAIVGDTLPDPRLKPLIPDAEAAARKWAETHGGVPINHMMVVRTSIAKERPDVVKDIFRALRESRSAAAPPPRRPARSLAIRRRGQPPLVGDHHRLLRAAEAHPARVYGRRIVRGLAGSLTQAQPPANSSRMISSSSHCSSAAAIFRCSSPSAAVTFSNPARSRP